MPLRDNGHHKDKLAEIFAMQHDAPVSSILPQENRFSPLPAAGFFSPSIRPPLPLRRGGFGVRLSRFQLHNYNFIIESGSYA
jgi:hypothetical protein